VVVATPGRLFDLVSERQILSLRKLEYLILDEADKLLEQGHEVHLNTVLGMMPKQRRTGLFSATMPSTLKNFIKVGMRNPYYIEIHIPKGSSMFTEWVNSKDERRGFKLSESVTIRSFDQATIHQVSDIQELPEGLMTSKLNTKLISWATFLASSKSCQVSESSSFLQLVQVLTTITSP
jgi:superfamily II DNA/RNA helicase